MLPVPSRPRFATLALGLGLLSGAVCATPNALAATMHAQGALLTTAGGPVADGNYVLVASLYEAADAQAPAWQELLNQVPVQAGGFDVALGAVTPIPDALLSGGKPLWLGVQVGGEPELPRVPLRRTWAAWHAAVADALSCTGCVTGQMLAPASVQAGSVDFTYAGSASKGGPATSALIADQALKADVSSQAEELACSGCVQPGHLAVATTGLFLSSAGGTVTGDTTFAAKLGVQGEATLASAVVQGAAKFGTVDAPCAPGLHGVVRWTGAHLELCRPKVSGGDEWVRLDREPAPLLTSISPTMITSGGGQTITIKGGNFAAGVQVLFGNTPAAQVTVLDSVTIQAIAPALPAGTYDVTVEGAGGSKVTLEGALVVELDGLVVYFDAAMPESYPASGGNTWFDLSGSGANATMVGGLVAGERGGKPAMVFNGTGAGAEFPNGGLNTQQMSAIYWIWSEIPNNTSNTGGLYVNRNDTSENADDWVWFGNYNNDQWYFRVNGGDCCNDLNGSGAQGGAAGWFQNVPNGQWRMVHFGFEAGKQDGWRWSSNSSVVAKGTLASRPDSQTEGTSMIGYGHDSHGGYFKGGIGSVRFYDRLLSEAEVAAEFARLKSGYGL